MAGDVFHLNGSSVDDEIDLLRNNARVTFQHPAGSTRLQVHHDERRIRAACRIDNEDAVVPAIHSKIIDESVLGSDRDGQIDDAVQLVGLRIPADKFRRDAAAHPIVEHPDDSIDVGADAQNRIQRQVGMALPIVQFFVRKWG